MGIARSTFFICALIGFLFLGCSSDATNKNIQQLVTLGRELPDLILQDVDVQSYGLAGIEWRMVSPSARGLTKKNIIEANDLTLSLFKNGKKSSDVFAKHGILNIANATEDPTQKNTTVTHKGLQLDPGDMLVTGNVVVVSTDGTKLMTDWLSFKQETGVIRSTAPVEIIREDSITKGVGLEANANLSRVKIFKETLVIKDTSNLK